MIKIKDYIHEMESAGVLTAKEYTFHEYVDELLEFQAMLCKMISGDAYHDKMRIEEASIIFEGKARKKDLRNNPAVHNCVQTMKKLSKEIAITMSGAKGESVVSKTLEYLERPNTKVFRNVYVTDGFDETELDAIVLTNTGIVILEVKNIKTDLKLTEEGRMVFASDECYDKVPLGTKMQHKRMLLRKRIQKALADSNAEIPVSVDSFIVFSTPKGQFVHVDDRYHKEKYCFRSGLNKKLENYVGSECYQAEEFARLDDILSSMESNVRRFKTELDFDAIRRSIAEGLVVLQDEADETGSTIINVEAPHTAFNAANVDNEESTATKKRTKKPEGRRKFILSNVLSAITGMCFGGALTYWGIKAKRA